MANLGPTFDLRGKPDWFRIAAIFGLNGGRITEVMTGINRRKAYLDIGRLTILEKKVVHSFLCY